MLTQHPQFLLPQTPYNPLTLHPLPLRQVRGAGVLLSSVRWHAYGPYTGH